MRFIFGEFTLDIDRQTLMRGGRSVSLGPMAFPLLRYLIENRSRVVGTDEIHRAIWDGRVIGQSTIPTAISSLRKALGDRPRAPRFIESRYGVGYRFVAEVVEASGREENRRAKSLALLEMERCSYFLGRSKELRELDQWLENGSLKSAHVCGPAGSGKSRLLEHFAARHVERRHLILFGRCREIEAASPYSLICEIISDLFDVPGNGIERLPSDAEATIKALVDGSLAGEVGPGDLGASGRHNVVESIIRLFDVCSVGHRPVLIVDDFHRIDAPSAVALRCTLGAVRGVKAILAFRPLTPTSTAAAELARLERITSARLLELGGLSPSDSRELVQMRAETTISQEIGERIWELTAGNPFFLTRLADLLRSQGETALCRDNLKLPVATREAVLEQIEGLSEDCRELLSYGAAFGREFDIDVLRLMLGWDRGRLDRALEEGRGARIVDGARRERFAHVLLRDALYEWNRGANPSIHAAAFHAMRRRQGEVPGPQLAEWARHAQLADGQVSPVERVEACEKAGRWAVARFAFAEGAALFEAALAALGNADGEFSERRCDLLRELAECQHRADQRSAGQENARRSYSIARRLGDVERMARAVLAYSPGFFAIEVGVIDRFLVDALEDVRRRLSPSTPVALRVQIGARLAMALYWGADRDYREAVADSAVEMASDVGGSALAYALTAREVALWDQSTPGTKEAVARAALTAAIASADHEMELVYRVYRVTNLLQMGRAAEAREEIGLFSAKSREIGHSNSLWFVSMFEAMEAMIVGEKEKAVTATERFVQKGREVGDANADHCRVVHTVYQRMEFGPLGDAVQIAQDQWRRYQRVGAYRCSLPYLYWESGDEFAARVTFEEIAREGFSSIPRNVEWLVGMAMLAEGCAALGDSRRAVDLYRLLLPHKRECVVVGFGVAVFRPVSHFLGRLAATMGHYREAESHLSLAIGLAEVFGSAPWRAHAQYALAEMLVRRRRAGDVQRAAALLGACTSTAAAVEMSPLLSRARRLSRALSGHHA